MVGSDAIEMRSWEQGRRSPERAVQSYLRVIAAHPKAAGAQEEDAGRRQHRL